MNCNNVPRRPGYKLWGRHGDDIESSGYQCVTWCGCADPRTAESVSIRNRGDAYVYNVDCQECITFHGRSAADAQRANCGAPERTGTDRRRHPRVLGSARH